MRYGNGFMAVVDVVGLVPMAGRATRLGRLPGSKELLPLGFRALPDGTLQAKVVSHYLLETFRNADIHKVVMVLRPGKWDIPAYYRDGGDFGLDIAYTLAKLPHGVPYTLDSAYSFVKDAHVALGFPDIVYEPPDVFRRLRDRLTATRADVVLGLFPASAPERSDMVAVDADGRVHDIVVKPLETRLTLSWGLALWSPRFTEFLHAYLKSLALTGDAPEMQLAPVFLAALAAGLELQTQVFETGTFLDVGTPEGLELALNRYGKRT